MHYANLQNETLGLNVVMLSAVADLISSQIHSFMKIPLEWFLLNSFSLRPFMLHGLGLLFKFNIH